MRDPLHPSDPIAAPAGAQPSGALHETIRAEIEDNILSGRWPPGHRVPSELDLCRHYNCARMTVSRAMTELVRAGLIARKRRAGSVVLAQRSQNAILEIHDLRDEVLALGKSYRYALLSRTLRPATATERSATGLPARRRVIALTCLHYADDAPFCLEERIIDPTVVHNALDEGFTARAPGPWLLDHVPWSEAEHRIRAENATEEVARILGLPPGAACLIIERSTWKSAGGREGGESVTHVRFSYPGTAFVLQARFTPGAAPD